MYTKRESVFSQSWWTDTISNKSRISKILAFDRELIISKSYERALKSSFYKTLEKLRRRKNQIKAVGGGVVRMANEMKISHEIDRQIEEDNRKFRSEAIILLLGDFESRSTLLKQIKIIYVRPNFDKR